MKIYASCIISLLLLLMSGCTGHHQAQTNLVPIAKLRKECCQAATIKQGISSQITDPTFLTTLDSCDSTSPNNIILKEIATATNQQQRSQAFDRLWQNKEVQRILTAPTEQELDAQALLVFLLADDSASIWKKELAHTHLQKILGHQGPTNFYGYSLLFLTQTLLKTGHTPEALVYLDQLQKITDPQFHLQNQLTALNFAYTHADLTSVGIIMVKTCKNYGTQRNTFPDREMSAIAANLRLQGTLAALKPALLAAIPAELADSAFARELQKGEHPKEKQQQTTNYIQTKVQVMKADSKRTFIDPRLQPFAGTILADLNFTSLALLAEHSLNLRLGGLQQISLPEDQKLLLTITNITNNSSSLLIKIFGKGQVKLSTTIQAQNGGVATLAGGSNNGETLLLRITLEQAGKDQI